MEPITEVLSSGVLPLQRYAVAMNKPFEDSLLEAGRKTVRYALRVTPPFTGDGGPDGPTGAALERGKGAISRDLHRHFRPVRIKGIGPGAQDPYQIYLRLIRAGRKRFARPLQRDQAAPYFVDATKFGKLERQLHKKVGKLASGWVPAHRALNAKGLPAWVTRHSANRGGIKIDLQGGEMSVSMFNDLGRHVPAKEIQRRVDAATVYAARDMNRAILGYLSRKAVESGLAVNISAGAAAAIPAA